MADSNVTKKALSTALKELMTQRPFAKISVGDICERCGMNRKSFYYHFKDKYDLVNWIYDTECIALVKRGSYADAWDFLLDLCTYFYENRVFYRKALEVRGQDSFIDHFRDIMTPIVELRLREIMPAGELSDFQTGFFTEALVGTICRWITRKDCLPPEEFIRQLRSCVEYSAISVCRDMEKK